MIKFKIMVKKRMNQICKNKSKMKHKEILKVLNLINLLKKINGKRL